jgi:hypothetical protein
MQFLLSVDSRLFLLCTSSVFSVSLVEYFGE